MLPDRTREEEIKYSCKIYRPKTSHPEVAKMITKFNKKKLPRELVFRMETTRGLSVKGSCGLFLYAVILCNTRTIYKDKRINEYSLPCYSTTEKELLQKSRMTSKRALHNLLNVLVKKNLIYYDSGRTGRESTLHIYVRRKIAGIGNGYSIGAEKRAIRSHSGFVFMSDYSDLRQSFYGDKFSEADLMIDLFINAVYNDPNFLFSKKAGLCVFYQSYKYQASKTRKDFVSGNYYWCSTITQIGERIHQTYSKTRWQLAQLESCGLITVAKLPRKGSVIFINDYGKMVFPRTSRKNGPDIIPDENTIAQITYGKDPNPESFLYAARVYKEKVRQPIRTETANGRTKRIFALTADIIKNELAYIRINGVNPQKICASLFSTGLLGDSLKKIDRLYTHVLLERRTQIKSGAFLPNNIWTVANEA